MGLILRRQSRNFLGGVLRSPASGHTTVLSSTRLRENVINLNAVEAVIHSSNLPQGG